MWSILCMRDVTRHIVAFMGHDKRNCYENETFIEFLNYILVAEVKKHVFRRGN